MKNKTASLQDMVKLRDNENLSEEYIRYICGLPAEHQYRHSEIEGLYQLYSMIERRVFYPFHGGFIYGYTMPHFNEEFDLLKFTGDNILNIELKSSEAQPDKVKKQLRRHGLILKKLGTYTVFVFSFIYSKDGAPEIYSLDEEDNLIKYSLDDFCKIYASFHEGDEIDLDEVFSPEKVLISPIMNGDNFIKGLYFLTNHQKEKKEEIINYINTDLGPRFVEIKGSAGTGKTLLAYDIAKELSTDKTVLIVHCGKISYEHTELNKNLNHVDLISIKNIDKYLNNNYEVIVLDEAQRVYKEQLISIIEKVKEKSTTGIFSYDPKQRLSDSEMRSGSLELIENTCKLKVELKNSIRYGSAIQSFINYFLYGDQKPNNADFSCVRVIFEPNKDKAKIRADHLKHEGYKYIAFTPSMFNDKLNYQYDNNNTHSMVGREADNVCMIINSDWKVIDNKLISKDHPNSNYIYINLLYEGLTRARKKLALVICDPSVLEWALKILEKP